MAGPLPGLSRTAYLVITHPDNGDVKDVLTITQAAIVTTQPPQPTFTWALGGGFNGDGVNPTPGNPSSYQGSTTSGNLSNTDPDSVAAGTFSLWAAHQDANGNNITSAPSGGWSQYLTTPTYIYFIAATWVSSANKWEFSFQVDSADSGFPNDANNDVIGNIYCTVTGSNIGYSVIIDAVQSCHVAGTVINLADGTTKLVENLQVGDILASYDISGLGHDETSSTWQEYSSQLNQFSASSQSAEVVAIQSSEFGKYVNFNNGLTKVTEEHPVLIKDSANNVSFKQVVDVVIGDSFYINDTWVEITSKEVVEETITAYTIDVEERDVYVADGILWHNAANLQKVF
jgi:hypothetical protein